MTASPWCDSRPEQLGDAAKPRFTHLYEWLRSGKIEIRVLPDDAFGRNHPEPILARRIV
ncbi:MAG: hypothetical protein OXH96_07445 [Spirochaetaceae bacterium]|nr:hypothetical protein [Spirochaetaceae bacterium]